jgi:hypothetical protein
MMRVTFVHLQHSAIAVRSSSLLFPHDRSHSFSDDVAEAVTSASNAPLHELHSTSDFIFHKAKFAIPGSFSLSDVSMAASRRLAYSRYLGDKHGDEQCITLQPAARGSIPARHSRCRTRLHPALF